MGWLLLMVALSGCAASAVQVIPTQEPTITPTFTPTLTATPDLNLSPTRRPTRVAALPEGVTPTALLGPTRTPRPNPPTPTRPRNPNAPLIEFFTSDVLAVAPGSEVTLYWSARNVDGAVIYRLNEAGQRTQVLNVPPDGQEVVSVRRQERGQLAFLLTIGEGERYQEVRLNIPIQCPVAWFFSPAPEACADEEAVQTRMIEQVFQRGRMLYVEADDQLFALFNDGREPAWLRFTNRYDPEIHAESEPNFVPPPGFFQPLRELGFLWRGNEVVRNRLGLGIEEASAYQGLRQTLTRGGETTLYLTSADGRVLEILPDGDAWTILGP